MFNMSNAQGGAIDVAAAENLGSDVSPTSENTSSEIKSSDSTVEQRAEAASQSKNEAKPEEGGEDEPLHKNPRFRQIIKQNRELRKKLEEREQSDLEKSNSIPRPEVQQRSQSVDVYDRIFDGAPEHEFKPASEYKDLGDLFKDFRKALLKDFDYTKDVESRQKVESTTRFEKQLQGIKEDIGDDSIYGEFSNYLLELVEDNKSVNDVDDEFEKWYRLYVKYGQSPTSAEVKNQAPAKATPKVNRSSRPPQGTSSKPSADYIRKKSFDEIISEKLGL